MLSSDSLLLLLIGISIITLIQTLFFRRSRSQRKLLSTKMAEASAKLLQIEDKYAGVIDIDAKISVEKDVLEELRSDVSSLRNDYAAKRKIYESLKKEVAIFDDSILIAELGIYEPHFEFTDSEQFKKQIKFIRDQQKILVSDKRAVTCDTSWSVDGSSSKGQAMTNRGIRLTLRAFNNECDAAIANTRWNNVTTMEKRINRAFEQIDKLNKSNAITISDKYLILKIQELECTHEYRERQKIERDERSEANRIARDEKKLLKDALEAEKNETHYQELLNAAKEEAENAVGSEVKKSSDRILELEEELKLAHEKSERAKALAEQTRSGFVYIISNVGSFGEGIVKIGLTRRADPDDRVRELGDASVPFKFDTHAIIYSEDAPALENALHNEFNASRVNAANLRKEFFRASIDDVQSAVLRLAPEATFFRDIEAQEYHETLARRNELISIGTTHGEHEFPQTI